MRRRGGQGRGGKEGRKVLDREDVQGRKEAGMRRVREGEKVGVRRGRSERRRKEGGREEGRGPWCLVAVEGHKAACYTCHNLPHTQLHIYKNSVVWFGVEWCGEVHCGVVWCGVVWRSVVKCIVVYGVVVVVQCGAVQLLRIYFTTSKCNATETSLSQSIRNCSTATLGTAVLQHQKLQNCNIRNCSNATLGIVAHYELKYCNMRP